MKKVILILASILFLLSCSDDSKPSDPYALHSVSELNPKEEFFPMNTNNTWEYEKYMYDYSNNTEKIIKRDNEILQIEIADLIWEDYGKLSSILLHYTTMPVKVIYYDSYNSKIYFGNIGDDLKVHLLTDYSNKYINGYYTNSGYNSTYQYKNNYYPAHKLIFAENMIITFIDGIGIVNLRYLANDEVLIPEWKLKNYNLY